MAPSVTSPPGFWVFSIRDVLPQLVVGLWLTVRLTVYASIGGIVLGLFVSLARISSSRLIATAALFYVTLLRGTPLLIQILFIYFAMPQIAEQLTGRPWLLEAMPAGILALSLNAAAYMAEIFRAAIESIDKGQMEAARALGMSRRQALWTVILPQTFQRIIPPLVNEMAALSKDTSLVSVIALSEMLYISQRIANKHFRHWEAYLWAAAGYLIIVVTLTTLANWLERRLEARGG
jgi:His/Glu/Gln/Arg/opine family amino acid ABC transporter permease subunit